jgi:ABC-type lipoprotein release transport system permease subunit
MLRLGILAVSACAALTASIGTASIAARRILLLDPSEVFRTI